MKLDPTQIDPDSFMVHQHFVGDEECFLVQPIHIGAKWTKDNLNWRSALVTKSGEPVSLSFPKFFNWDEHPELDTPPSNLKGAVLMEKLDGSTLLMSRRKRNTVRRTRGTANALLLDNGYEVDYLCQKYANFYSFLESHDTTERTFIFEWLSPTNRIVLNYGDDPDMALIAIINHSDYSLAKQRELDLFAQDFGLRRPRRFSYDSIDDMRNSVEVLRDQEGLCVYYNNEQSIRKVKSAHYLYLHRAKSEISSVEKVIDVYIDYFVSETFPAAPSYTQFFDYLSTKFDFEIATMARGHASKICDAMKEVSKIMEALKSFAEPLRLVSRKEAALKVLQAYGSTGRSSMIFKMLDNKPIVADDWKKLLYQVMK